MFLKEQTKSLLWLKTALRVSCGSSTSKQIIQLSGVDTDLAIDTFSLQNF